MTVIERAEKRLNDEERQHDLGADNANDLAYWAAYIDGARAQKKECQSAWIRVEARLPEDGTYVLGYMAYGQCSVLKCEGGRLYMAGCWVPLPKNAVTHWMPLPDAPEVEE